MSTRFILFLARRVLARIDRCDATPSLCRAVGHLLIAFPGACIITLFSLIMPRIRFHLDHQAETFHSSLITDNAR